MKVSEIMTRQTHVAGPDETIADIARRMAEQDVGFLPVAENDRVVGTVTDRDIVVRGLAAGKDARTKVRDVMTADARCCREEDDVDETIQAMGKIQVRRMPVVDAGNRLVGVVSLADAVLDHDPEGVGIALTGVVEPGGSHSQSQGRGDRQ
jgi:CBS domain-containing protein